MIKTACTVVLETNLIAPRRQKPPVYTWTLVDLERNCAFGAKISVEIDFQLFGLVHKVPSGYR